MTDRLTIPQAMELYSHASLHELGALADAACRRAHPEAFRTFAIDRNINYTNVCCSGCRFCAYYVRPESERAFVLDWPTLLAKVDELHRAGGTHVLLQGGLNPELRFEYHLEMLRQLRAAFPHIGRHAFSPPEIWFFHRQYGLALEDVFERLIEAGLESIPGGGAEILSDRVRLAISPHKCTSEQWLGVMRLAHQMGLCTTATMMFGHVETVQERFEHLCRLRELQDESLSAGKGRFTAFIGWTFQSGSTELASHAAEDEMHVAPVEYLRMLAISRLVLDNFANIQASWVTQGPKIGQLALFYGANDMGGAMMEENVVAAAGTVFHLSPEELRQLITSVGHPARQRDHLYRLIGPKNARA